MKQIFLYIPIWVYLCAKGRMKWTGHSNLSTAIGPLWMRRRKTLTRFECFLHNVRYVPKKLFAESRREALHKRRLESPHYQAWRYSVKNRGA